MHIGAALEDVNQKFSVEKLKWRGIFNGWIQNIEMAAGFWLFLVESLKWRGVLNAKTAKTAKSSEAGNRLKAGQHAKISKSGRRMDFSRTWIGGVCTQHDRRRFLRGSVSPPGERVETGFRAVRDQDTKAMANFNLNFNRRKQR